MRHSVAPSMWLLLTLVLSASNSLSTACSIDLFNGVSTALSCNETSLVASWSIKQMSAYKSNDGVESVDVMHVSCTFNGSEIIPTQNVWTQKTEQILLMRQNATFIHQPDTILPVGAECRLTGCYTWIKFSPFTELTSHQLPKALCTVPPYDPSSTTPTANEFDYSPTESIGITGTMSHSSLLAMGTVTTPTVSPRPSLSAVGTVTTPTVSPRPSLSAVGTVTTPTVSPPPSLSAVGTVTTVSVHPSPSTLHTPEMRPSPRPADNGGASESGMTGGLLAFFLTVCGFLLVLCVVFLGVMIRVVQKTRHKSKQIDRKYFDDLKHFDSFHPVDILATPPTRTVIHPALISAEPMTCGNSNSSGEGSGSYVLVGGATDREGTLVLEGTMNALDQELLNVRVPVVDAMSRPVSFDLESLQSLDVQNRPLAVSGFIVTETESCTKDYVEYSVLTVHV